ncbi:MAG: AAA-like domain-containing protein [Thainema sp.]
MNQFGQPLSVDSPFYIQRNLWEETVGEELQKPGSLLRIRACPKMGKSSLLLRLISQAAAAGITTVQIDFRQLSNSHFSDLNELLRWFCTEITRQLGLESNLEDYWDDEIDSKLSCTIYFENYLLEQIDKPLVITLDELDWIFEQPAIAHHFLALLRFWYELAQRAGDWQKLRWILAYSSEISIPLRVDQSPFNIGLQLNLFQFTQEQVHELAQRYGFNWQETDVNQLINMVGGHPYLVHAAIAHLAHNPELKLSHLLEQAATPAGIYQSYLQRCWSIVIQQQPLVAAIQALVRAKGTYQIASRFAYHLVSLGIIQPAGSLDYQFSCQLYADYFRHRCEI